MATAKDKLSGRFITFEGIDGCGKTTQASLLAERLREAGVRVLETREPGGTAIGQDIRKVLLDPQNADMASQCELLLYLADRIQHLQAVIRPALARGETVICDRFHDSTLAYQRFGRGLRLDALEPFIEAEIHSSRPDVTFWLDLHVGDAGIRRAKRRRPEQRSFLEEALDADTGEVLAAMGETEPGEREQSRFDASPETFQARVQAGYLALWQAEPERIVRVDARGSIEAIADTIWGVLEQRYAV